MSAVRQFRLSTSGTSRVITHLTPFQSILPLYTCDVHEDVDSVTVHAGSSKAGPILGAARVSSPACDILLAFGDPQTLDNEAAWELMWNKSKVRKISDFEVSLELPSGDRREFRWKGTQGVKRPWSKFDKMKFVLVDEKTGAMVARFVHQSKAPLMIEGRLEMFWDLGAVWDTMVVICALGLLKYSTPNWQSSALR